MRKIAALVEQNGMPRKQLTVATYRAPTPAPVARAKRVTAVAKGDSVTVKVTPRKGAAARWEIQVHFPSGSDQRQDPEGPRGTVKLTDTLAAKGAGVRCGPRAPTCAWGR